MNETGNQDEDPMRAVIKKLRDIQPNLSEGDIIQLATELKEAFMLFDYSKSAKISTRDIGPVVRSMWSQPSEAEVQDIMGDVQQMETIPSRWDLEMAKTEISAYKAQVSRLESDLTEKATQVQTIEVERNFLQQALENALANSRRLKEELDERNQLNQMMQMELRLQEMMTKADNEENERGLSLSPSRRQRSDMMTEIRQLRLQMENMTETNQVLRQKLEKVSQNRLPNQSGPSRSQLSDLMMEIHQLRIQMEKTVDNNNILRMKLEEVSRNPPPQSVATKIITDEMTEGGDEQPVNESSAWVAANRPGVSEVKDLVDRLICECREADAKCSGSSLPVVATEQPNSVHSAAMLSSTEDMPARTVHLGTKRCYPEGTVLENKAPFSQLMELGKQRKFTPSFKLMNVEGPFNKVSYIVRGTAEGFVAEGKGPTKKKATQAAAALLLDALSPFHPTKKRKSVE